MRIPALLPPAAALLAALAPARTRARAAETVIVHNVAPVPALWPAGAPPVNVPCNQDATVAFDRPGIYGVQCIP
jgi:plastocyanin